MKDKLLKYWFRFIEIIGPILLRFRPDVLAPYSNKERITVYVISVVLALFLWSYVNLNREFIIELPIDIELESLAKEKALIEELPYQAFIKVRGEGWQLLSLYNNPPKVDLNIENDQEIDLQVRLSNEIKKYGLLTLEQVSPAEIQPKLSQNITKRVPVVADFQLELEREFYPISQLQITPDSLEISGAVELINAIEFIKTVPTTLKNVQQNLNFRLGLLAPDLVNLNTNVVEVKQQIAQFTEAEKEVEVRILDVPNDLNVVLNPRTIKVRFDVPLTDFKKVDGIQAFAARIKYSDLVREQSGYFIPKVSKLATPFEVIYKDHQPKRLRYFINRNN